MPEQDIPIVPQADLSYGDPAINEPLILPPIDNPYLSVWWATQTVSNVPENVMGWLVAQGYEITGITQDTTTVPPTNYFSLTRQGMQPQAVLLNLCNSYTVAANEAREANQIRYNQVIHNWNEMIEKSHDQFDLQTEEQNVQSGMFLTDLDDYMTAVEALIASNQSELALDAAEAKTALVAMDSRLTELETNAADSAVTINDLLTEQETSLDTYIADYDTRLGELQQNVADHIASVLAEVSSLGTVLDNHVADYAQQFDSLTANYNFHLADIDALLANVTSNVSTYVTDVSTILTALDDDYQTVSTDLEAVRTTAGTLVDAHVIDYAAVLALLSTDYTTQATTTRSIINFLLPDYTTHSTESVGITDSMAVDFTVHSGIASGLLDGLGATELARINEEFAGRLSVQLQSLVTRGLSTATLIADITERNHRDRDEQIQLLNDRLAREKLANQNSLYDQQRAVRAQTLDNGHRLYEQKRAVRAQIIDSEQRLYEQQLGMRTRTLDGKSQLHTVQQEVLRYQATLISGVYAMLQETRNRVLSGKQAIFAAKDATERLGIEVQTRLYTQLQDVRQRVIESSDRIYQLRDVYAKWANTETHRTYEQLQQVRQQFLEAVERQHSAKQNVTRAEMSQRDILLQQLQAALTGVLGGKERFSNLLMQNANILSEHKHRAIVERMNTAAQRLEGWKSVAAENRKLMAYQLDERNKLLIGLYSFVERRDDIAPEWKDMATMIASLGDSGGGWITP
jgi:hypothetical protein